MDPDTQNDTTTDAAPIEGMAPEVEVTPEWVYKVIIGLIFSVIINLILLYFMFRKFIPKLNIFK